MPAGSATKHRNLQKRMDLREAHKGGTKRLTFNPNPAMEETEMPETNAIQAAYEQFKLEWMLAHGYTLKKSHRRTGTTPKKESPELSLSPSSMTGSLSMDLTRRYGPALRNSLTANIGNGGQ